MKQIIFGAVIALLLSGFFEQFLEQAFAHINGANSAKGEDGIKGGIGGNVKMEQKVKMELKVVLGQVVKL